MRRGHLVKRHTAGPGTAPLGVPIVATSQESLAVITGRLSAARRHHPDRDTTDLEREVVEARIAAYAEKVLADAPPLTPAQVDRLAAIFRGGGQA